MKVVFRTYIDFGYSKRVYYAGGDLQKCFDWARKLNAETMFIITTDFITV